MIHQAVTCLGELEGQEEELLLLREAEQLVVSRDFSDVTFVYYDDEQNKAHTIILAWPDHSKIGQTAGPKYTA